MVPRAHPIYKYLKNAKSGTLGIELIKWNFTKFLISKNGKVLERFSPSTEPKEIESIIKKEL